LTAVGDPGLRSALAFVRAKDHRVTADELAAHEGVHRNVARSRLERLATAGLVETDFDHGRRRAGRPAKTYRAAPELEAIEFPCHHSEDLLALLAEGRSDLHEIGVAFGRQLAKRAGRPRGRGLESVCEVMRSLGFQATVEGETIVTPTCPLRPLVAAHSELAAIDEGMWAGLVGGEATCRIEGCLDPTGSCRVRVSNESRR
jgi:predicted ArsR family transcriptional regulator